MRLNGRIATALERHFGDSAAEHAEELFRYFSESETVHGAAPLIKYASIAGNRALATHAPHEAERYFTRALMAKCETEVDEELANIVFGLGKSQVNTLPRVEVQKAVDTLGRAFDLYGRLERDDKRLDVALTFISPIRSLSGKLRMLDGAPPLAPGGSRERADLLSQHALWVNRERADYETAKKDLEGALRIARTIADSLLEFRTLTYAAIIHQSNLDDEEAEKAALAALKLSVRVDDPGSLVPLYHRASSMALGRGDYVEAERLARAALDSASRIKNSHLMTTGFLLRSVVEVVQGRWESAQGLLRDGLELDPRRCDCSELRPS